MDCVAVCICVMAGYALGVDPWTYLCWLSVRFRCDVWGSCDDAIFLRFGGFLCVLGVVLGQL